VSDLGRVIRLVRFRLGMNTTDFARLLGVAQSQVSRYEAGTAKPGYLPMARLLHLAEGAERNPIMSRLAEMLEQPREKATEVSLLSELERMGRYAEPLWGSTHPPHAPSEGFWDEFREFAPNLAELLKAVSELCDRRREIDSSLVRILRLWLSADDSDPNIRQRFADAAKYIEVGIAMKENNKPAETKPTRRKRSA
jgi:transcriptional regulator with XRE-family HTH domain